MHFDGDSYTPTYVDLLRSRTSVPRVTGDKEKGNERLLILPDEPENVGGRPLGKQYWDRQEKIDFMDRHGIDISVGSISFFPDLSWEIVRRRSFADSRTISRS